MNEVAMNFLSQKLLSWEISRSLSSRAITSTGSAGPPESTAKHSVGAHNQGGSFSIWASSHSLPLKSARSDLSMLIAFRAGRERAGVSQNVAPVLDKLPLAAKWMVERQCASNRRHDAIYVSREPACFPLSSSCCI